jgi:hypothetical protein
VHSSQIDVYLLLLLHPFLNLHKADYVQLYNTQSTFHGRILSRNDGLRRSGAAPGPFCCPFIHWTTGCPPYYLCHPLLYNYRLWYSLRLPFLPQLFAHPRRPPSPQTIIDTLSLTAFHIPLRLPGKPFRVYHSLALGTEVHFFHHTTAYSRGAPSVTVSRASSAASQRSLNNSLLPQRLVIHGTSSCCAAPSLRKPFFLRSTSTLPHSHHLRPPSSTTQSPAYFGHSYFQLNS